MMSLFYDDHHVVLPVVKHRLCLDYFISYTAYSLLLLTFLWSFIAVLLSTGLSYYFLAVSVCALIMLPWSSYGEWAISTEDAKHVYTYTVGLLWLCFGLMWSAGAGYVHVRQGKEAIEENWYALQTQILLPFTTQLQFKGQFEGFANALLGLGISTGLSMLLGVVEGWKALGGHLVMVQLPLAGALAEGGLIITLAAASAGYSTYGITVAAFATNNNSAVSALTAHAVTSHLALVLGAAHLAIPLAWGPTFLAHALLGLLSAVPFFVLLVTSFVLQSRALTIDGFVQPRWAELQQFVPTRFQGLQWDKYAEASYTPMQEAAMTGLMLSLVLLVSTLHHLKMANLLWSVGPQLSVARARLAQLQDKILSSATAGFITTIDLPLSMPKPAQQSVQQWGSSVRSKLRSSFNPLSLGSADAGGGPTLSAGLLGASANKGYGSVASIEADFTRVPLSEQEAESASRKIEQGVPLSSLDGVHRRSAAGSGEKSSAAEVAAMQAALSMEMPVGFSPGVAAAAEAKSRFLAMQSYHAQLLAYDKTVGAVAQRMQAPTAQQWVEAAVTEMRLTVKSRSSCLFIAAVVLVLAVVGISVGMSRAVDVNSKCAVLAYAPATSSYSTWFQLESGDRGHATVTVQHSFPFGSVQLIAEHAEGYPEQRTDNMTVELTAYGAEARYLPTPAQLQSMVNLSTNCFIGPTDDSNDDDVGGCLAVSFALSPGGALSFADAANQCLGLRIRIITATPALLYDIQSKSAFVNISGNAVQFVDGILNNGGGSIVPVAPIFQSMSVSTDTATIVGNNIYAARYTDLPPLLPPSLILASAAGNMYLKNTVAQSSRISTSGNIVSTTTLSASTTCAGICGDMAISTTGAGKIIISQLLAAYSVALSSEHGEIIFINAGIDFATDMKMTSVDGPITLSNFVALHGNNTFLRTAGKVTATVVFANRLDIAVTGQSTVSVTEAFLGMAEPTNGDGDIPFNPVFTPGMNYSTPALLIRSERGDVTVIGVGGDPRADKFSKTDSVYITTFAGDIKLEVNGGGVNANYTLVAPVGSIVAEVGGVSMGSTGQLGVGSDPVARNVISLYTQKGDVQLAELPSVL